MELIRPHQATIAIKTLEEAIGPLPQGLLYTKGSEVFLTPELRDFIASRSQGLHLWAIDMRTIAHPMAERFRKSGDLQPLKKMENLWKLKLSTLPTEVRSYMTRVHTNPRIKVILVDDCPMPLGYPDPENPGKQKSGYWRHHFFPEYKGGRKQKPSTWGDCTKAAYSAAQSLGIPVVRFPYFEADDIFGSMVRHLPGYPNILSMGILTVDTDLLQLVSDPGNEPPVYWYNLLTYEPRFRDYQGTVDYWLKRHKREILGPREIVEIKAAEGDKSDNLPPGTDPGLIDLLYPKIPLEEVPGIYGPQNSRYLEEWETLGQKASVECMIDGTWDSY